MRTDDYMCFIHKNLVAKFESSTLMADNAPNLAEELRAAPAKSLIFYYDPNNFKERLVAEMLVYYGKAVWILVPYASPISDSFSSGGTFEKHDSTLRLEFKMIKDKWDVENILKLTFHLQKEHDLPFEEVIEIWNRFFVNLTCKRDEREQYAFYNAFAFFRGGSMLDFAHGLSELVLPSPKKNFGDKADEVTKALMRAGIQYDMIEAVKGKSEQQESTQHLYIPVRRGDSFNPGMMMAGLAGVTLGLGGVLLQ